MLMNMFEHIGVWCGREHGALVDRRCDKQLLQDVLGFVVVEAAALLQLRRRILTHLLMHARGAGADYMGDGGLSMLWAAGVARGVRDEGATHGGSRSAWVRMWQVWQH